MSIAEKLQTVAENVQKVYDAGYEKGKSEGSGTDSYYDTFWDTFQQNGERTNYYYAFYNVGWTDENLKPKYVIVPKALAASDANNASYLFANSLITEIKDGVLDTSGAMGLFNSFARCPNLVKVANLDCSSFGSFGSVGALTGIFHSCTKLEQCSFSNVPSTATWVNAFLNCTSLTTITITDCEIGNSINFAQSSLLSNESVQMIINALVDLTGQATQTITFHGDVFNRMTDEQKIIVANKNWSLAAIA